jgi:hypothetical protein
MPVPKKLPCGVTGFDTSVRTRRQLQGRALSFQIVRHYPRNAASTAAVSLFLSHWPTPGPPDA